MQPPVLGFAAFSGTGKTTLLVKLIPLLKEHGLRVGVIKHSHHDFQVDRPGKDSFLLRAAGATPVMVVSPYRRVLITEFSPPRDARLQEQLAAFPQEDLDLLLVEGFRDEKIPKIELHRAALGKPLLYRNDPQIIAVASDTVLQTPTNLPCLDLNSPESVGGFIVRQFLGRRMEITE